MNIKLETPRDTCEMRQSQQEEQDQSQTTSDWTPIDRTGDARRSVTFDSTALDEESSREVPELNGKLTKLEPRIAVGASIYGVFLRKARSSCRHSQVFVPLRRHANLLSTPSLLTTARDSIPTCWQSCWISFRTMRFRSAINFEPS